MANQERPLYDIIAPGHINDEWFGPLTCVRCGCVFKRRREGLVSRKPGVWYVKCPAKNCGHSVRCE